MGNELNDNILLDDEPPSWWQTTMHRIRIALTPRPKKPKQIQHDPSDPGMTSARMESLKNKLPKGGAAVIGNFNDMLKAIKNEEKKEKRQGPISTEKMNAELAELNKLRRLAGLEGHYNVAIGRDRVEDKRTGGSGPR